MSSQQVFPNRYHDAMQSSPPASERPSARRPGLGKFTLEWKALRWCHATGRGGAGRGTSDRAATARTSRGSERLERVLAAIGHLKVGDWEAPSWHEIAISSCTPASWARARCSSRCSSRFRVSCAGATSLCFPAFCFHRARPCYHRRRPGQTSPADAAPLRSSHFGVRPLYYGSLLVPLHQLVPQRQRALQRLRLMPSKRARAAGG